MKICFFADGQSSHTVKWCEHFQRLGHEVHLISFRNCNIEGVFVHYINSGNINVKGGNWKVLLKFFKVRLLLKKIKPDILHAHYATSYGITAALTNFHPLIISGWGSDILVSTKSSKIMRYLIKWALKKSDAVTIVADHMLESVVSLGIPQSKVKIITHGINTNLFHKIQVEKHKKFTFVCTRNLEPLYNHIQLLEAFEILIDKGVKVDLILIGDGSLKKDLIAWVEQRNLLQKIRFLGRISQEEMLLELNKSHVFITVSTTDGDVVSLVEAIACGNYCIASDIPANRSWIKHNVNGLIVPLFDKEALANAMIESIKNYSCISDEAIILNKSIIENRGNWNSNMILAENLYNELIKKRLQGKIRNS
jgi:glycosyltransferase involved in cell wall biosynthesis